MTRSTGNALDVVMGFPQLFQSRRSSWVPFTYGMCVKVSGAQSSPSFDNQSPLPPSPNQSFPSVTNRHFRFSHFTQDTSRIHSMQ